MDTPSQPEASEHAALDLGLIQTLKADGQLVDVDTPVPTDDVLAEMHALMLKMRRLDERMMLRQRQGKIGFYGAVTGQEATPVATVFATQPSDWIFPALRENAIMLGRGFPLEKWLAQVYGNSGDVLKGRQMPSHMSGREVNQVSWGSCLGPQLTQAVGAGLAARARGDDMVSVAFLGDGTTSEPDFHTAMNFAGVTKAPCVIVCQNNHWAISVPSEKQTAAETFAIKARAYGMPGLRVDGNDVLALTRVLSEAVERARCGEGPSFIEAVTYRIGAHSSSDDPTRYRSESSAGRSATRCCASSATSGRAGCSTTPSARPWQRPSTRRSPRPSARWRASTLLRARASSRTSTRNSPMAGCPGISRSSTRSRAPPETRPKIIELRIIEPGPRPPPRVEQRRGRME